MKKRIWELDALRGILMIAIMLFHLWYDLVYLYGLISLATPFSQALFRFCGNWLGMPFLVISGLCVTIGSRPIRRGLQVIGGGMIITAVTVGMYLINFAGKGIIIYFGVLHCIGVCMLLWPLLKKLPNTANLVLGILMVAVGLYLKQHGWVDFPWLVPFGLVPHGFSSSDYFPLLPNLGYFLIGSFFGRKFYAKRASLLPKVNGDSPLLRPFCFIGRNSLIFYLLHQPVMAGAISLWLMIA